MGYLRTLLAITVVLAHSPYGEVFVGGQLAVQIFYMISGFLIAHVLRTNPTYADPAKFYANRMLRIYPVYLVVALATLIFEATFDPSRLAIYKQIPFSAALLAGISNVTLFGQDWVMFSGVADGHLHFFADFTKSNPPLWHALLAPQAWTLGVELTFYALAPFILRKSSIAVVLLVLSCTVRLATWKLGFRYADPWTYRFFPSELAIFLLGALSNRHLLPLLQRTIPKARQPLAATLATVGLVVLCLGFSRWPLGHTLKPALLFVACAALLPLAFMFQRISRTDKAIGELSYPIYIVHMLVIWSTASALAWMGLTLGRRSQTLLVVVVSCLAAYALNQLVAARVERIRDRIRSSRSRPDNLLASANRMTPERRGGE